MTPVAANSATQLLTWKVPSMVRNSPTKPDVPGSPTFAMVNTRKAVAYRGMRFTRPP